MNSVSESQYEQLRDLLGNNFPILINTYIEDNRSRIILLGLAIDEQNWLEIRHISHSMKSSSANIGATVLADLCQKVEHGTENNLRDVQVTYGKLCAEFEAVVVYLNKHL